MTLARLKTLRVVVSLILLAGISLLFVDVTNALSPSVAGAVTAFQIIPALLKSLSTIGLWTAGVVGVFVLTLIVGRVYCSSLCPLGTLQDLIIRFSREVNRRRWFVYRKPMFTLHYGVLAVTTVLVAAGSLFLLNLIEPFSNYGRIMASLVKPVAVVLNNLLSWILGLFGMYGIAQVPLHAVGWGAVGGSLLFLAVLGYLSYNHGRLFCNTICPAGAILSLISRVALFKIVVDHNTCIECGLCERVCKAHCISSDGKKIDYSACVGCFNCFKACPTVGLKFARPWGKSQPDTGTDQGRRKVIAASFLPFLGFLPGVPDTSATPKEIKKSLRPVTPPGAMSEQHLTERCTACHLCISVCPTQVLAPTFLLYGVDGMFQPHMDYLASYCNYDCTACGTVCPSGAIHPMMQEDKRLVQVGQARFLKEECIVEKNKKDCGACSEHCPTKAVKMVPYEGKLFIPELNNDLCVGCGGCEHACPTKPQRAIYVEASSVHGTAKKPEVKKLDAEPLPAGEFPF